MTRPGLIAAVGALLGAGLGHILWFLPLGPIAIVGPPLFALIGFLLGWKLGFRTISGGRDDENESRGLSDAFQSMALIGSAVVVASCLWGWVAIQSSATFHDQGGMILTLIIWPWTMMLWIAGGPLSLGFAQRGLRRLESAPENQRVRRIARAARIASTLIVLAGVGSVVTVLYLLFRLRTD